MTGIASIQDVDAIEVRGTPDLPPSTYELIQRGATLNPDAPALSFFLTVDEHRRPETWTHGELLARITLTANVFDRLGAKKDTVIAFVLPNLPETHFVISGGQPAGIVVAINPLLEPAAIASLLEAAGAEILVTLAPFAGMDIWGKIEPFVPSLRFLKHVVLIDLARRGLAGVAPKNIGLHDFWKSIAGEPAERLVSPGAFLRLTHRRGFVRAAPPAGRSWRRALMATRFRTPGVCRG